MAQSASLFSCVFEDALGDLVGLADYLGPLDHPFGLCPHIVEKLVGLALA